MYLRRVSVRSKEIGRGLGMKPITLADLTQNEWTLMEFKAKRITFRLGEEIIKEEARIDHLFVIRTGSADVEVVGTNSRTLIATLLPGDICGEMAFLGDSKATATVVAKDELEVDAIWADDLRQLTQTFPGFGTRFYRSLAMILEQRLRQTVEGASAGDDPETMSRDALLIQSRSTR